MVTSYHTLFLTFVAGLCAAFNNPPGVKVWCGKAYLPEDASFDPGGEISEPSTSPNALLDLTIRPRMSFYLAQETGASFIVDASISYNHGSPLPAAYESDSGPNNTLSLNVTAVGIDQPLVENGVVSVNSTGNELSFSLQSLAPRIEAYEIILAGALQGTSQMFNATAQLSYLPSNPNSGSSVKIDSLTSGLLVPDEDSNTWTPFFPYSYYVSWGGYLNDSIDQVNSFASLGYNMIHVVPGDSPYTGFNFTLFNAFLDRTDELGLWVMYDMRNTYQNLSSVAYQVDQLKSRKSLLLYYTADEPDGNTDPLNATSLAYQQIRSQDPYHPVSLVLNCYNFYYEEYTAGADIVLEDTYPFSNNVTYSLTYDTPCNTTYGCCGCDDCHLNPSFSSIPERQDRLAAYQSWVGGTPKPRWGVPQAFGNQSFWTGIPDSQEEAVMTLLRLNHGAKGIVMWDWPEAQQDGLQDVTSQLANALTASDIVAFLLGVQTGPTAAGVEGGIGEIDAALWTLDDKMLVSVVSMSYQSTGNITISLPSGAESIDKIVWGDGDWTINADSIHRSSLSPLEVDLLILNSGP